MPKVPRVSADDPEKLRRVRLAPYRRGNGPVFILETWETARRAPTGQILLRYRLTQRAPGQDPIVLFEGSDFGCSPMYAIDSDKSLAALLGFLTLRPGDTDAEYFESYTPEQLAYCREHAEALAAAAIDRFGED